MRRMVIVALVVWFFQGLGLGGEPEGMEKAKATYQNICESCHGPKGDGKGITAPTLRTKPKDFANLADKSEDHLFKVTKEGGAAVKLSPLMPAYGSQLSDEEIRQMVRYVLFLSEAKR